MTKAQELGITKFPYVVKDENDNIIYSESSDGFWVKREFDSKGNQIYYEQSSGYFCKREFDSNGKLIYFEDSNGYIEDNRPKNNTKTLLDNIKENGLFNDKGMVIGLYGESNIKHFHMDNILSAIKKTIDVQTKYEKTILNYTNDSAYVSGLKEFVLAVESNKPITISGEDGKIKLKSF